MLKRTIALLFGTAFLVSLGLSTSACGHHRHHHEHHGDKSCCGGMAESDATTQPAEDAE
jgi:hypothetical protein